MPAVNKKHLSKAVGYLYVAPLNETATIVRPTDNGSNAKEVFTAIETAYPEANWQRVASIVGLQISEDPAADKQSVITDDTGLIYASAKRSVKITATWYESKNPEVLTTLIGVGSVKDPKTGTPNDIYSAYELKRGELSRFAVKIDGLIDGTKKEKYYIVDATIAGQIITQFQKNDGSLEGSNIEIEASEGGFFAKKLPA